MAIGEMPFKTPGPGDVAPTTFPGAESKTREDYDNTEPPNPTRRRLLLAGLGVTGLVALGALAWPKGDKNPPEAIATPTPSGENPFKYNEFELYPQVFFGPNGEPIELGPEDLKLPESLDPPTFEAAFANMGQAIEYYVNMGDLDGIQRIIPGTVSGDALSPAQFKERSIFTTTHRRSGDAQNNFGPENAPSRYAWGFQVKMLQQISAVGANPRDTKQVKAHVQIAMGDYRKPVNGSYRRWTIEQPIVFEGEMLLTRYTNIRTGDRPADGGWCVWQMPMYNLPPTIRDYPPEGYETMPLLYPGLGI